MRMPIVIAAAIAAMLASPAHAQNMSVVMQNGFGNAQTTMQSGRASALTMQNGNGNSATTVQSGQHTYSSIVQIGDGHERTHVMTQDYSAMGSVQVDAMHPGATWDMSGGAAAGGVQLHFGVK